MTHRYRAQLSWDGSTADGFDQYTRAHEATAPPATDDQSLRLSADPAFKGDPSKLNPEQLLVIAASSCQMLSFLAFAARARIDVTHYEDEADGEMPEHDKPMRITRITLRPTITIRGATPDDARLAQLVDTAHRHCFVANSLATEIRIEPAFRRVSR